MRFWQCERGEPAVAALTFAQLLNLTLIWNTGDPGVGARSLLPCSSMLLVPRVVDSCHAGVDTFRNSRRHRPALSLLGLIFPSPGSSISSGTGVQTNGEAACMRMDSCFLRERPQYDSCKRLDSALRVSMTVRTSALEQKLCGSKRTE